MSAVDEKHVVTDTASTGASDQMVGEVGVHDHARNGNVIDDGLQRGLKGRHLQMIALGGVVG